MAEEEAAADKQTTVQLNQQRAAGNNNRRCIAAHSVVLPVFPLHHVRCDTKKGNENGIQLSKGHSARAKAHARATHKVMARNTELKKKKKNYTPSGKREKKYSIV